MASVAETRGAAGKPPVSAHPAFPAIVALWFAALLGLGSLAVPAALLEQGVLVSGLAKILPAAEPPLGVTAHALVALVGAVLGAVLGFVIARRMARAHGSSAPRRAATSRKPINALDELGNEGLDGGIDGRVTRRRSLALTAEGGSSEVIDRAQVEETAIDALDLHDFEDEVPEAMFEPEDHFSEEDAFEDFEDDDDLPPQTFVAAADATPGEEHADTGNGPETVSALEVDEDWAEEDWADEALADEAWIESAGEPVPDEEPNEVASPAAPMSFDAQTLGQPPVACAPAPAAPVAKSGVADEPRPIWADAALEDLGLVQLAQRLADSIARHRQFRSTRAALAASTAAAPHAPTGDFEVAEADDAVEAMAAYFARPDAPAVPVTDAPAAETFKEEMAADSDEAAHEFHEPEDDGSYVDEDEYESDAAPAPFAAFAAALPEEAEDLAQPAAERDDGRSLFARLGGIPKAEEPADEIVEDDTVAGEHPEERQIFRPSAPRRDDASDQPFPGFAPLGEYDDEDEEDDDIESSFSLPLSTNTVAAIEEELEADEPADMTGYGSLLGQHNPFKDNAGELVRIEDEPQDDDGMFEPTVVFPGESRAPAPAATGAFDKPAGEQQPAPAPRPAANPEENERALREALLNLQRMSGAA